MLKEFEHILGLSDLCSIFKLDENNKINLITLIGYKFAFGETIGDVLMESELIKSKSLFKKNPQSLLYNGNQITIDTPIPEDDTEFVLTIGKGSSLKTTYILHKWLVVDIPNSNFIKVNGHLFDKHRLCKQNIPNAN